MSTDEYVPDGWDLRDAWRTERDRDEVNATEAGAEFDRFLARVRRDAWNEGAQAQADTYGGRIDTGPNPYEETP